MKLSIGKLIFAAIFLLFLAAQLVSIRWMGVSMMEYLREEFLYVVMIPADVYQAYQEGAASGIEFIIGIPSRESRIIRDYLSEADYEKLTEAAIADTLDSLDESLASAVKEYVNAQAAVSSRLEARSKVIDQWIALCIYRCAWELSEGGNEVRVMYWDEKPLIEN